MQKYVRSIVRQCAVSARKGKQGMPGASVVPPLMLSYIHARVITDVKYQHYVRICVRIYINIYIYLLIRLDYIFIKHI